MNTLCMVHSLYLLGLAKFANKRQLLSSFVAIFDLVCLLCSSKTTVKILIYLLGFYSDVT